jgi:TolB protein
VAAVAFMAYGVSFDGSARAEEPKLPAGSGSTVAINIGGTVARPLYPIALPPGVAGDGKALADIYGVQSFDLSVAGVFRVVDPGLYVHDVKAEGMGVDPAKWKEIGAFGVVKFQVVGDTVEFKLYEVSKGKDPTLTRSYKKATDWRTVVHKWCNEVVKFISKEPGFFGSKILFTAKGKNSAIMAMDFDGANAFNVSRNSSTNMLGAWGPGGVVAYTSFMRDNPDLYVGAVGGRPKRVSSYPGMNTGASFNPSGSEIAITLSKDGNAEIYVISASDGKVLRRITNNKAIDTSPAWSPDGGSIAFVSDRNGGPQIFVAPAGGGGATLVSTIGTYNTTPAWSPRAGKRVLAYTTRDGANYDIVTLDLDTKQMTRITQGEGNNEEPSFSPNGRAIAFARAGVGVFIANADGTGKAVKVWSGGATGVDWGPAPKE